MSPEIVQEDREARLLRALRHARAGPNLETTGLLRAPQPSIHGEVILIDGAMVAIRPRGELPDLEADSPPRYSFAVYLGSTYKGEAVLIAVHENALLCRIELSVEGMRIEVGDQASTNTF